MALIKREAGTTATPKSAPAPRPKVVVQLAEMNEPSHRLQDWSFLIFGEKKIGKTALAARFPGAYFLSLEPGARAQRVRYSEVPDWDHFVAYIDLLVAENDPDITIVVDVIDLGYEMIYSKICKALKIDSPTEENDYGATWRKIKSMFREQIIRILNTRGGKVFLSHDAEKEVELRDGTKVERVQPTMGKQAMGEVVGLVDVIGCYAFDGEDRVLHIKGHQRLVAGSRLEENFVVKGRAPRVAGNYVTAIPMGSSPTESFANLDAAFNNLQETADGKAPPAKKPDSAPGASKLRISRK